jgi:hypothetical protein
MENAPRTRLITAVLLVVVFGSGLVVGFAVDTNLLAGPVAEPAAEESDSTERRRVPMYEQVGPNETQMASIDSIVQEHREGMKTLHREFRDAYDPRYRDLLDETRLAIRSVFDPDQAMAYDSLLAEYDRRRRERRDEDRD